MLTISARNAVHSALFLISTLISVAGLFLLLHAEFVAGVQILVYVGGVLVLFLFVIMLVSSGQTTRRIFTNQFAIGVAVATLLGLSFFAAISQVQATNYFRAREAKQEVVTKNTEKVGLQLYTQAVLPFEIASLVLLVAIVAAVRLARDRKQEKIFN